MNRGCWLYTRHILSARDPEPIGLCLWQPNIQAENQSYISARRQYNLNGHFLYCFSIAYYLGSALDQSEMSNKGFLHTFIIFSNIIKYQCSK